MTRYRDNWLLANFVWHRIVVENRAEYLERTAQVYADIYHSIGTARWSLSLALGLHLCIVVVNACTQGWQPWG